MSDWSSDVCSSDLITHATQGAHQLSTKNRATRIGMLRIREKVRTLGRLYSIYGDRTSSAASSPGADVPATPLRSAVSLAAGMEMIINLFCDGFADPLDRFQVGERSEEHTSELQSLMRNS